MSTSPKRLPPLGDMKTPPRFASDLDEWRYTAAAGSLSPGMPPFCPADMSSDSKTADLRTLLDPADVLAGLNLALEERNSAFLGFVNSAAAFAAVLPRSNKSGSSALITDAAGEAAGKTFFGLVRRLRESTLVCADLAAGLLARSWEIGRGSFGLCVLLGPNGPGAKLALAGEDVSRVLESHSALAALVEEGVWEIRRPPEPDEGGRRRRVDPLLAGLTTSGRLIGDAVLAARQKRGIVRSLDASEARGLLSLLATWHGLSERIEEAEGEAALLRRQLAELSEPLRAAQEFDARERAVESLEKEVRREKKRAAVSSEQANELERMKEKEVELLERLAYWEEAGLTAQNAQSRLPRIRTQVKSLAAGLELATDDLRRKQAETEEVRQKQRNVEAQVADLTARLESIRASNAKSNADPRQPTHQSAPPKNKTIEAIAETANAVSTAEATTLAVGEMPSATHVEEAGESVNAATAAEQLAAEDVSAASMGDRQYDEVQIDDTCTAVEEQATEEDLIVNAGDFEATNGEVVSATGRGDSVLPDTTRDNSSDAEESCAVPEGEGDGAEGESVFSAFQATAHLQEEESAKREFDCGGGENIPGEDDGASYVERGASENEGIAALAVDETPPTRSTGSDVASATESGSVRADDEEKEEHRRQVAEKVSAPVSDEDDGGSVGGDGAGAAKGDTEVASGDESIP